MLEIVASSLVDVPAATRPRPGLDWARLRRPRRAGPVGRVPRPTALATTRADEARPVSSSSCGNLPTPPSRCAAPSWPCATGSATTTPPPGHHHRGAGVGDRRRRVPGLHARAAVDPARHGHPGPVRQRLPPRREEQQGAPSSASHAWVEVWNGGWEAFDPTNDRRVGSAHVVVAKGRDYADVPPLRGIYAGGLSGVARRQRRDHPARGLTSAARCTRRLGRTPGRRAYRGGVGRWTSTILHPTTSTSHHRTRSATLDRDRPLARRPGRRGSRRAAARRGGTVDLWLPGAALAVAALVAPTVALVEARGRPPRRPRRGSRSRRPSSTG